MMADLKKLAILGSTGSIGRSTLEVLRLHPARFKVLALAAGTNVKLLSEQVREFKPAFVSVATEEAAGELRGKVSGDVEVGFGATGAERAATYDGVSTVVSAIVGAAGLRPTLAAIEAGRDIALANKETLVIAGGLVMEAVRKYGVKLLPVDSEHSAVFQALAGHRREDLKRLILTASGGPFLNTPIEALGGVTPDEALAHPNWDMGRRISIDSATLMNKGFEVIEARWLFGVEAESISVTIHPQSIVHSMVEYVDGSIVAQMGTSDMKGPIAYALSYPERVEAGVEPFDFGGKQLDFMDVDGERYPSLGLAYKALRLGGTAPAALNAADEVAVEKFLAGEIPFTGIWRTVAKVLDGHHVTEAATVDDVLEADRAAREKAEEAARKLGEKEKV